MNSDIAMPVEVILLILTHLDFPTFMIMTRLLHLDTGFILKAIKNRWVLYMQYFERIIDEFHPVETIDYRIMPRDQSSMTINIKNVFDQMLDNSQSNDLSFFMDLRLYLNHFNGAGLVTARDVWNACGTVDEELSLIMNLNVGSKVFGYCYLSCVSWSWSLLGLLLLGESPLNVHILCLIFMDHWTGVDCHSRNFRFFQIQDDGCYGQWKLRGNQLCFIKAGEILHKNDLKEFVPYTHISKSNNLGWLNRFELINAILHNKQSRSAGLCGDTVYIDFGGDDTEEEIYHNIKSRSDITQPNQDLGSGFRSDQNPSMIDNFIANLKNDNAISIASQTRDDTNRLREEVTELQKQINFQIQQGAMSIQPGDSISRANGETSKGLMRDFDLDNVRLLGADLDAKIDLMKKYISKLESPKKAKLYYEDGERSIKLGSSIDALTVFDTPHPSYSKEDYEADLQIAHENSGITKIDGEWCIPRPPKTMSHTLIPMITNDKWLNFLIRLHVALFLLLGTDPYPPKNFMSKFLSLRRGKYSDMHASMDLLQIVLENTIDFDRMRVKKNNFCLPILEEKMRISESIIASTLISLLAEYKLRWTHLFKDCVIPTFVQPSSQWDIRSVSASVGEQVNEKLDRRKKERGDKNDSTRRR